jgi:hypothetical protein
MDWRTPSRELEPKRKELKAAQSSDLKSLGILKLDESCSLNPKSETLDWTGGRPAFWRVQFAISDFGFKLQDSSNFKIPFCLNGC